jgi:hypothetical protein
LYGYQLKEGSTIPGSYAFNQFYGSYLIRGAAPRESAGLRMWRSVSDAELDTFFGVSAAQWSAKQWEKLQQGEPPTSHNCRFRVGCSAYVPVLPTQLQEALRSILVPTAKNTQRGRRNRNGNAIISVSSGMRGLRLSLLPYRDLVVEPEFEIGSRFLLNQKRNLKTPVKTRTLHLAPTAPTWWRCSLYRPPSLRLITNSLTQNVERFAC